MIAIVDYGVGNLFSLKSSLDHIGLEAVVTGDAQTLRDAEKIILPGVGAFADAAAKLAATGLDRVVCDEAAKGKPMLGICLGMQMLFDKSYEYGEHPGLSLIPGNVKPIRPVIGDGLKVPHIGWNSLDYPSHGTLFQGIPEGSYVYFVHSYYLRAREESIVKATTEYGVTIHASVEKDNVYACQFHPEKSSQIGMKILQNFINIGREGN